MITTLVNLEREFLQHLDFDSEQEAAIPPRFATTCDWIFLSSTYERWRKNPQTKILWIVGTPGSGKSVLAKHVLRFLREQASRKEGGIRHAIGYFLRSSKPFDLISAVKSLLFQLLCADPALFRHVHG